MHKTTKKLCIRILNLTLPFQIEIPMDIIVVENVEEDNTLEVEGEVGKMIL